MNDDVWISLVYKTSSESDEEDLGLWRTPERKKRGEGDIEEKRESEEKKHFRPLDQNSSMVKNCNHCTKKLTNEKEVRR